jgi:hypothetical protein
MDNLHRVMVRKTTLLAVHRMAGGIASREEVSLDIEKTSYELLLISTLPRPADAEAVPLLYVEEVTE